MNIQLSDHFTYRRLIRFTVPTVAMMIFTSVYGVVDGIFVSNFVGKTPFAALNLIMPFLMISSAVGFMIGTGGSALVSMTLGMGDKKKANSLFSLMIYVTAAVGLLLTVVGLILLRPMAIMMGAEGEILEYCVLYGRICLLGEMAYMLQNAFQSFMITAERPQMGLWVTVAAGVTNIVLDALFVGVLKFGLAGAAWATVLSQMVGGFVPLGYFLFPNRSLLKLGRAQMDGRALVKTCTNGSSEFMTNISMSVVNMLFNLQLMRYAGEDGVAAYGVLMYVSFIFISIFLGYSFGVAPVVGYHYGAQNRTELQSLFGKSLRMISVLAVALTGLAIMLAKPLAMIFVGYDGPLLEMTTRGFIFYSLSFLFSGFSIFGSSFFTALNNGLVSAIISFMRTLVFQIVCVLLLPQFFGLDGIWLSVAVSELLALGVTAFFLSEKRPQYGY